MTTTTLLSDLQDGILLLTLDGPKSRNAIGPLIYAKLQDHIIDAGQDPDIRAIVLHGANGFFCSGGDVNNLKRSATLPMRDVTRNTDALNAMITAIRNCPKPVVAAVEGGAAGAGFSLVLACDLIVASAGAKFIAAYVKIGLTPDGGITHFLTSALPRQLVSEMCLMGTPVSAEVLCAHGIVNKTAPAGQALNVAMEMAARLAVGPQLAMAKIKSLITSASSNALATHLQDEAYGINQARFTDEGKEGTTAFLEKRKPNF